MTIKTRRERFRVLLEGPRCILPGSVFDPLSARIAQALGFEVGMLAGSTASLTVLGAPDLIVLTLTEFAEQARRIGRAADLPLLVDADHGYGNALNVMRTVEELETAGVAALTIEDTRLPQPFGMPEEVALIPLEEGVAKVRAALAARQDNSLVIAARTAAPSVTGLDDALARCRAYREAGADAVFITGLKQRSDLEAVCADLDVPIMLGALSKELEDLDFLSRNGVRIGLQGHLPIRAAAKAVHDTLKALREGTSPRDIPGVATPEIMKTATRDSDYKTWIREFLAGQNG